VREGRLRGPVRTKGDLKVLHGATGEYIIRIEDPAWYLVMATSHEAAVHFR